MQIMRSFNPPPPPPPVSRKQSEGEPNSLRILHEELRLSTVSVGSCSKTQHCGSILSTSANLRRQCKVTQQQRQLFSFCCKSAHEGRASVSGGSHPHSHRLVFSVACFHIYFTIHIIRHKSQWKCSISLLLLFNRTQVQQ